MSAVFWLRLLSGASAQAWVERYRAAAAAAAPGEDAKQ